MFSFVSIKHANLLVYMNVSFLALQKPVKIALKIFLPHSLVSRVKFPPLADST